MGHGSSEKKKQKTKCNLYYITCYNSTPTHSPKSISKRPKKKKKKPEREEKEIKPV